MTLLNLRAYLDTDSSQTHRHSISGYTFHMDDSAVTWSLKKRSIIVLSSTEAEYVVQTHTVEELIWLCMILRLNRCKDHNHYIFLHDPLT
jgi:hypothetical protein